MINTYMNTDANNDQDQLEFDRNRCNHNRPSIDSQLVENADLQNNLPSISSEYPKKLLRGLNDLRVRGDLCDVTICVGMMKFNAHKNILSASSPYFRAMFTNNLAESKEQSVTLHDLDEEAVENIIDFAYTAEIYIRDSNVQSLLAAATLLQMPDIQTRCCNYIKLQIDPTNCLGIKDVADKYSCRDLLAVATKFLRKDFEEVVMNEEFLRLTADQLIEIISSDTLDVSAEEKVFEAVCRWIKTDNTRIRYLPSIMQHVRLSQMDPRYLVTNVSKNPLVQTHEKCREYVDEAKNFLLLPEIRKKMNGPQFRPRRKTDGPKLYAVGGWVSGDAISSVERYDPQLDKWVVVEAMKKMRCGVGVAVLNNSIYAVGGHDGKDYLRTIERYQGNHWVSDVASLESSRTSIGVATHEDCLYVIGGQDGPNSLDLVDKYNSNTNNWTCCAPLGKKRLGAGVAVLDEYIYAIGGSDANKSINSVERYDPVLDEWRFVAPMLAKRKHLGCTALNGYIYVVGGRNDVSELNSAERYDPRKDIWEPLPQMSLQRSGVGFAAVNGLLYAVGGFDGTNYLKSVEAYNPAKEAWYPRASMLYSRLGGGVAVIN